MNDPKGEIRIRPMATSDLDRVLAIADGLKDAPQWPRSAYLTALNGEAVPRRIALVANRPAQEEVCGFLVGGLVPPEAELESIAVAEAFQRHGIGKLLIEELTRQLGGLAVQKLHLEIRSSNASARAFYQAAGFVQAGIRRGYYVDPIEDACLMELQLVGNRAHPAARPKPFNR
jgi:[ribosomal protein S18]-alanine N-acetyltransferase